MGEHVYGVSGYRNEKWQDMAIQFSEMDDDTACLCTFPHNFTGGIDAQHVRSLALLGAAVVLAHQGELEDDYNFLPFCIPTWIRDEIEKRIK
jgi:hypothetical protein